MRDNTLGGLIRAEALAIANAVAPQDDEERWINDSDPPHVQEQWPEIATAAHARALSAAFHAIRQGYEAAMEKAGRSIERCPLHAGGEEVAPRGEDLALFKSVVASDHVMDAAMVHKEAAINLVLIEAGDPEAHAAAITWLERQPVSENHAVHDSAVKVIQDESFFAIPDGLREAFNEGIEERIIAHLDEGYTYHDLQAAADLRGVQEGYRGAGDQLSASAAGDLLEIHAVLVEVHLPKLMEAMNQQGRTSEWER